MTSDKWQVTSEPVHQRFDPVTRHPSPVTRTAFTLIEVMVVMVLLSLIVIALMGVFSSTQAAFRASVTQTDILEGGRAAMDLITGDLRAMSPSGGTNFGAVNFYANTNYYFTPLIQPLTASSQQRTNVLQQFFILSRQNQTWTGVGYIVVTNTFQNNLYSLYRFSMTTNVSAPGGPVTLFNDFINYPAAYTNSPPWSHLIDGVVGLRVRAYDPNGLWLTNGYIGLKPQPTVTNTFFFPSTLGEVGFAMYSNTLPASVEIEMATLEDRSLQRAESRPAGPLRDQYLQGQAGAVHVFRQRVAIPQVDPAAYQ